MAESSWRASELTYIDVGERPPPFDYNFLCPIVLCPRCEKRYIRDSTRYATGERRPDVDLDEWDRDPRCEQCLDEQMEEAFEASTLATLERRLGLTEENKKTLQALMNLIENPDRVMMVARLHERVDEVERRLEDRVKNLNSAIESKLAGAETRLYNSSLIVDIALTIGGFLAGVVVTLVLVLVSRVLYGIRLKGSRNVSC